jgi:hypothetical protein
MKRGCGLHSSDTELSPVVLRFPWNVGNLLANWATISFSKRILTEQVCVVLTLQTYSGGTRFETNLGQRLTWLRFSLATPGICWGRTSFTLQPLPSKFFPNHYSAVILPLDATQCHTLAVSQNKQKRKKLFHLVSLSAVYKQQEMLCFYCACT